MIDFDGYWTHFDHHFRPLPHTAPNPEKDFESAAGWGSWTDLIAALLDSDSDGE